MAKVNYIACDCCGAEVNTKQATKITISKATWKKDRTLNDVCSKCTNFILKGMTGIHQSKQKSTQQQADSTSYNDPTPDDDFVESKINKLKFETISAVETNPECPHYNRTRIRPQGNGRVSMQQKCRDCGAILPLRDTNLSTKVDSGVRLNADAERILRLEGNLKRST